MKKIFLGAVFIVAIAIFVNIVLHTQSKPPVALVATSTSPALNADAYPLYPDVEWGQVNASTVDGVSAYEVLSNPFINITNLAEKFTPFFAYYKDKLTNAGWVEDITQAAGGPGSEVSVYAKGTDEIIISYQTVFHTKSDNAPSQCPCDLQFSVASKITQK